MKEGYFARVNLGIPFQAKTSATPTTATSPPLHQHSYQPTSTHRTHQPPRTPHSHQHGRPQQLYHPHIPSKAASAPLTVPSAALAMDPALVKYNSKPLHPLRSTASQTRPMNVPPTPSTPPEKKRRRRRGSPLTRSQTCRPIGGSTSAGRLARPGSPSSTSWPCRLLWDMWGMLRR